MYAIIKMNTKTKVENMEINKNNKEEIKAKQIIDEDEELGSSVKELLKPENLVGPFDTVEEMMKSLLDEE